MKKHWQIILIISLYVLIVGYNVSIRNFTFQTQAFDLGVFESTFYNSIHGNLFFNTIENRNHLGVHFSPILILLIPIYFIWQSSYNLLILQTIILASGAFPLYLLGLKEINKKFAILLAGIYLLYPYLHNLNCYDFHAVALAVPLLLWAIYFFENKKLIWTAVFLFLAANTKENIILAVLFLGIYWLIFYKTKRKFSILVILSSIIYYFLVAKIFMPAFGGGIERLDRYQHLGDNFSQIIFSPFLKPLTFLKTIFTLDKFIYLFKIFIPVLFLFLLAPQIIITLIPGLAQNLLADYKIQFSASAQYEAILIPFVFYGLFLAFKKINKKYSPNFQKVIIEILIVSCLVSFYFFSRFSLRYFEYRHYLIPFNQTDIQKVKDANQLLKTFPPDASIAAHPLIAPKLIKRKYIYLNGMEDELTDYVIFSKNNTYPFSGPEQMQDYINVYLETQNYEFQDLPGMFVLIKKDKNLHHYFKDDRFKQKFN